MGIKGLSKFISDNAPAAVRQQDIGSFMGRTVAIDASLSLYQFMIAIRDGESFSNLTNEAGETTSHITGFLSRAVKLLENGVKPVYVFDGKPVVLKAGELAKRSERRTKAEEELAEAQEKGDKEDIKKFMGRTVRVTKQHNEDVKELLRLMGIPIIEAPSEAEAQCASLAANGLVYATATEDADALTFGSPILVRHLNFSDQKIKGKPILVFYLETVLKDLALTKEEFIDFCILCGCDYCDTIRGIGPPTAYKLIKQHHTIEEVLSAIDLVKHPVPENFPYEEARQFFREPEVLPTSSIPKLILGDVDEEGLRAFLVGKNNFAAARVEGYINRLRLSKSKSSQTRLEAFFGPVSIKPKADPPKKRVPPSAKAKGKEQSKRGSISWKAQSNSNNINNKAKMTPPPTATSPPPLTTSCPGVKSEGGYNGVGGAAEERTEEKAKNGLKRKMRDTEEDGYIEGRDKKSKTSAQDADLTKRESEWSEDH